MWKKLFYIKSGVGLEKTAWKINVLLVFQLKYVLAISILAPFFQSFALQILQQMFWKEVVSNLRMQKFDKKFLSFLVVVFNDKLDKSYEVVHVTSEGISILM